METLDKQNSTSSINVFLIGNNPIELSSVYEKLQNIKSNIFNAEIGFEFDGLFNRIKRFNPSCILIDDNIERVKIKKLLKKLTHNSLTKNIPVTVLKNSNYKEGFSEAQDYLLKEDLTSEKLSRSILNSIRFRRMQLFVVKKYRKNKSLLLSLFEN